MWLYNVSRLLKSKATVMLTNSPFPQENDFRVYFYIQSVKHCVTLKLLNLLTEIYTT